MNYLTFAAKNKRFLSFGLVLTLFSAFGQTFFLSLFNPYIQKSLSISKGELGLIYSLATFTSAILMTQFGRKIDHLDLRLYTLFVGIGLILAATSMAMVTSVVWLYISYVLLRLIGQGLMCHVAMVSMARYFEHYRGRAISFAALGYPIGQALFPSLLALCLTFFSWQKAWWFIAIFAVIFILPLLHVLLIGHSARHSDHLKTVELDNNSVNESSTSRQNIFFKDWRFYLITLGVLATAFINTGIFFQYHSLIVAKGWSLHTYASSFTAFAVGNVVGSLLIGALIDRFRSINILPFYLMPLLVGLISLWSSQAALVLFLFMLGSGVSQGASSVIISAVWSELYGTRNLGSIRSWVVALQVLSTGLSPVIFGYFLDYGIGINPIIIFCAAYVCFSTLLLMIVRLWGIKK